MKKIYSFVLMAAMLLVGTSVKAGTYHVSNASDFVDYWEAIEDGDELVLDAPISIGQQLLLNLEDGGYVVLNLNGKNLTMNNTAGSDNAGILIKHGRLEIKNGGKITNASAKTYDLIRLNGTNTAIDAKEQTPYSQVIIREGVLIENSTTNAISITEATGTNNLANGARIDVYGELSAEKYGIKVNGSVYKPANVNHSPYVWIHEGANVHVNANATKAVAAYSSGYARWLIEGYCGGSTGLYVKGGQVELHDATITSLNNTATAPVGQGSGVTAGGSAIVVESNAAYPGDMSVTITGNTEVSAIKGYAIEETITTALESEVELIKIESGIISGGEAGAIIVEDKTVQDSNNQKTGKVIIDGGNVGGNVVVDQDSDTGAQDQEGPRQLDPIDVSELSSYVNLPATTESVPTVVTVDGKSTIVFVPAGTTSSYPVTLNDEYLATFSAVENVTIPSGLKAYKAGEIVNDVLDLDEIEGSVIPAATGVILYNEARNQKDFTLVETTSNASAVANNTLKPAVAWLASYAGSAYILHGSELYLYNGIKMKENKAFLKFADNVPAPARIALRFAETQDVENIEAGVKAEKFIENGQIFIIRGEKVYNVQGQIVK